MKDNKKSAVSPWAERQRNTWNHRTATHQDSGLNTLLNKPIEPKHPHKPDNIPDYVEEKKPPYAKKADPR